MRLRYLFAIVATVLVSPFLIFWAWSSIEASRLDRAFDALEARHEPLDVAEFDPKPVTDEQRQASHLYAEAGKLVGDVSLPRFAANGKTIEDACGSAESAPAALATLKEIENRYARALELMDRAALLDVSGWDERDKPSSFSPAVMRPEQLAAVNAVRIARRACGDDPEHATDALFSTLRLRRVPVWPSTIRRMQTTHGLQLVLERTRPPAVTLASLQQEFERGTDDHAIEKGLLLSRAQWLSFAAPGAFSDPAPGFTARRMTPFEAIALRLSRPLRDHAIVKELAEFDEVLARAAAPWPQKLDEAARLERKYPRPNSRGSAVTNILNPFGTHAANSQLRFMIPVAAESLARARASIGAIAIARWRADHGGALPASLDELVPAYVSTRLIDPYSGAGLKYTSHAGGYRVYSVGRNRTDDGGKWDQSSDLQWARRGDPLDVGIAVISSPKLP